METRAATKVPAGAEGAGSGRQPQRDLFIAMRPNASSRAAILSAMLEVVGLRGYEGATLGMVLGPAGVSMRAFEVQFESKEDCYLAAFDAGRDRVEAMLAAATKDEDDWLGRFRVGLGALLEFLDREPKVGRALLVEVHSAGAAGRVKWEEALSRAAEFFDLARREPGALISPSEITARAVASGVYGRLHTRLARGDRRGVRELLPELVHFAVVPYFGPEVARREMLAAKSQLGGRAA